MMHRNARVQAAEIISLVMQGQSLTALLQHCDHAEKSFIQALCFGVIRRIETFQWQLKQLLEKPLPPQAKIVEVLCLMGLYQLQDEQTPAHAAIHETVNAVSETKFRSFKGLLNAILRRYQRESEIFAANLNRSQTRFNCPAWLLARFKTDWPKDWESICAAQAQKPPMSLRVNTQKISRENFEGSPGIAPSCVLLDKACDVHDLEGFKEGFVNVQDQAGQFIPSLLELKPGMRILDACSAPGSKLTHLFECCPEAQFTAIEIDKQRITRLEENIARLGMQAQVVCADARDLSDWWDAAPFDVILLDAPCSATGVIRRHPDIKLLRQDQDIAALQSLQTELLQTLSKTLKPGGQLLYTTCSVLSEENDAVIENFLGLQTLSLKSITLPVGRATQYGWQILPGESSCDGFYFSLLGTI